MPTPKPDAAALSEAERAAKAIEVGCSIADAWTESVVRVAVVDVRTLLAEREEARALLGECLDCDGNIDNPALEARIRAHLSGNRSTEEGEKL